VQQLIEIREFFSISFDIILPTEFFTMTTSTVRSYSPLALRSSLVFSTNNTTFPASPVNGQTVLVNGVLWCYSTIEGSAAWNPLTNQKNCYVHTQAVASVHWNDATA